MAEIGVRQEIEDFVGTAPKMMRSGSSPKVRPIVWRRIREVPSG